MDEGLPITEDWLKAAGFKWHQLERQPDKHWVLWLGAALDDDGMTSDCDLGLELSPMRHEGRWHCWLRSDAAHRYHRFIHVRAVRWANEIELLIYALTGRPFHAEDALYGSLHTPRLAAALRADRDRLDRRLCRDGHPWYGVEADEHRGRPLVEHMQAAVDTGKAT